MLASIFSDLIRNSLTLFVHEFHAFSIQHCWTTPRSLVAVHYKDEGEVNVNKKKSLFFFTKIWNSKKSRNSDEFSGETVCDTHVDEMYDEKWTKHIFY